MASICCLAAACASASGIPPGPNLRVQGSGFRIQGSGFRV
jgi:hypothetical protein